MPLKFSIDCLQTCLFYFMTDSECVVDSNLTPLPLFDKKTGQPIDRSQPDVRKGTK